MGYIGTCGPKGYAFSAIFVINGVSIDKGRTIRKVIGGMGKKPKKNSCKGKCQEKNSCKEDKEKKFMQKESLIVTFI